MEWTDESITRLRSLWQEGLSTAEIGRRMQITKNAVVGKAHRLTLSPRPSPIRKGLEKPDPASIVPSAAAVVPPAATPRPRPASSAVPEPVAASPDTILPQRRPLSVVGAPHPEPRPALAEAEPPALRPVAPVPRRRGLTCCWPLGEPGTKEFHFCGGDPIAGKPYCAQHAALAYVRIRDRRENVA